MRGWFDAFRTDGGPTLYAYSNRTSVTGDVSTITVCLVFITIYLAFLVIFPGVRKERFSTFCTVTLSLLTGIVICVCNFGSNWEVAEGEIVSSYRAFSSQKISASLGVYVGLDHANITLKINPSSNRSLDIDFNERFYWIKPADISHHYHKALIKGLPYPILTAAEYLKSEKDGFSWGRHYRNAGYYTTIVLWVAFTSWILSNILLLSVPRYGAYMLTATGLLMIGAAGTYISLKPTAPIFMRIEESVVKFELGWCFWMNIIVGAIVGISGIIISIMDWIYPHKFSTILEVDFDTPYDRHIIIEDSLDTRKRRFKIPRLEEPLNVGRTVGSRLLRRLSKRGGKETTNENIEIHPGIEVHPGIDNPGFELEMQLPAKSPWKSSLMKRVDSKKSNRSVIFKNPKPPVFLDVTDAVENAKSAIHRTDSKQSSIYEKPTIPRINGDIDISSVPDISHMERQDSCHSCASSSSSLGLGILSRDPSVRRGSGEENSHELVTRNNSGNIIVFHRTDSRGQLQRLAGEVVEIQTDDSTADW